MIELPICAIGNSLDENWNTIVRIPVHRDELPRRSSIDNLYLDFETTSENPTKTSINPHGTCKILGVAVLFDSETIPYYVPVRHAYQNEDGIYCYREHDIVNVEVNAVHDWLRELMRTCKKWVNHNIKYDFHVLFNEAKFTPPCRLIDTLNLSKLAKIEERFSYGLTEMAKVINIDISQYEARLKSALGKSQDYGLCPPDIMATYAAVDTLIVRKLYHSLDISSSCNRIVAIEEEILPVLIQIEQIGVKTDINAIVKDAEEIFPLQKERLDLIRKLSGYEHFDPHKKACLKELFVERLNWPVSFTEDSLEKLAKGLIGEEDANYNFGKATIKTNKFRNPEIAQAYLDYQADDKLVNAFILPYITEHIDRNLLIHSNHNQIVRTGRMSCTQPNMMQLSKRAKNYIVPYNEDYTLVNFDLSQIEFRVIAHYIDNKKTIEAYQLNPRTDYHSWVASLCGIERQPAKSVNFMLGYGGGKNKCIEMLSTMEDIIRDVTIPEMIRKKALDVFEAYHAALPELKPTQKLAQSVCERRGYVKTLFGRERHINFKFAYKAFNSVCQGTAADILKDITLRLRKFIGVDCLLHALVHDAWLFSIKKERVNELIPELIDEIERPLEGVEFKIPLICDYKKSDINWRLCE